MQKLFIAVTAVAGLMAMLFLIATSAFMPVSKAVAENHAAFADASITGGLVAIWHNHAPSLASLNTLFLLMVAAVGIYVMFWAAFSAFTRK